MEPTLRPSTARPEEFDEFDTYHDEFDAPSSNDRALAMVAHLSPLVGVGILAPLVIYLVKKEDSDFVADQAREALNFHITVMIGLIASAFLSIILIGIPMLFVIGVGSVVLSIVAAVKSNDGEAYRYPFTLRLVS